MTDRLTLEGQDLKLSPNAAQYLGLAFHELATNSTKHGAFATPAGPFVSPGLWQTVFSP